MAVCSFTARLSLESHWKSSCKNEKGLGWYLWLHFSKPVPVREAVRAAVCALGEGKCSVSDVAPYLAKEAVAPGPGSGIALPATCMEARVMYPSSPVEYGRRGDSPEVTARDWAVYYKSPAGVLVTAKTAVDHFRNWAENADAWVESGDDCGWLPCTGGVRVGFMLPLCFPPMASPGEIVPVCVQVDREGEELKFNFDAGANARLTFNDGWHREVLLKQAERKAEERRRERCQTA